MLDPALATAVARALRDLQYGTVQLTVHEGRVVHLERTERIRVRPPASPEAGTHNLTNPPLNGETSFHTIG